MWTGRWLIRRFADADAVFVFVDDPEEVPADATPFDMRGVALSRHAGDCSFETALRAGVVAAGQCWPCAWATAAVIVCASGLTTVPATITVGVELTPAAMARAVT
jgi:hypothetical protein